MGYRIKPGNQIMQGGKIFAAGCILDKVEPELMNLVDVVDEKQSDYQEVMINGVPRAVADLKDVEKIAKEPEYSTADVINNPDATNPFETNPSMVTPENPAAVRGPGRPKK